MRTSNTPGRAATKCGSETESEPAMLASPPPRPERRRFLDKRLRRPPCYVSGMEASLPIVIGIVVPIIGTVIASVVALGIMAWRITGRLDRRIDNDKAAADADRRAADADRRAFQSAMDTFRDEMRRLAERQSHVEGRFDERGSAAD